MDGDMVNKVFVAVICLVILAVGIFVMTVFITTTEMSTTRTEAYNVTDPAVDFYVNLTFNPSQKPTAEQYNGITWVNVNAADIEWSGTKQVIIEHEGMQG